MEGLLAALVDFGLVGLEADDVIGALPVIFSTIAVCAPIASTVTTAASLDVQDVE